MATRQNQPIQAPSIFSRSSRGKTQEEFLAELEQLMRRNRGGFSTGVEDTQSPTGFIVPGATTSRQAQFVPEVAGQRNFSATPRPIYPNIPEAPPQPTPQPTPQQQTANRVDAQDFFNQVAEAIYAPTDVSQPIATMPDGSVLYDDGSTRPQSAQLQPVATMADGSVMWSDGVIRPPLPDYVVPALGTEAISRGLFGTDQTITQPFGVVNPIEPTPGNINLGTDFRTRDLENRELVNYFNQPMRVIESFSGAQPGSGYVGDMTNRGYGNSVLVELPNGSRLRISHMDVNPWQEGQVINPGDVIGVPGSTGNVTGEHADVEVYNPQGQIIDPQEFVAEIRNTSNQNNQTAFDPRQNMSLMTEQTVQQPTQQQNASMLNQAMANRGASTNLVESLTQGMDSQGLLGATRSRANVNQQTNQTENMLQRGMEGLQNLTTGATDAIRNTLNNFSIQSPQDDTQRGTNIRELSQPVIDQGIDVSDVSIEDLQPGSGVNRIKSGGVGQGSAVNLFTRREPEQMDERRVVGESSGVNLINPGKTIDRATANRRQDTTDPFFSTGLYSSLSEFVNLPGGAPGRDQALSMDIFRDEFYDQPERVYSVFGDTFMGEPAARKATDRVKQQYRNRFSGDEYDQADVDRILSDLPDTLNFTPNLPEPKRVEIQINADVPSTEQVRDRGTTTGTGSQSVRLDSGRVVQAQPGQSLRVDSGGSVQSVKRSEPRSNTGRKYELSTPTKTVSAQPNQDRDRSGGLFSRFGNLFRRFFN